MSTCFVTGSVLRAEDAMVNKNPCPNAAHIPVRKHIPETIIIIYYITYLKVVSIMENEKVEEGSKIRNTGKKGEYCNVKVVRVGFFRKVTLSNYLK